MRKSKQNQTHIRYTADEYQRITEDALLYNESIPNLMKAVYFKRPLPRPFALPDDAQRIATALDRIGNNVNQIARQLNTGFRQGFSSALEEALNNLSAMRNFIRGKYGSC